MLITPNRQDLNKIVVINPKGGCGKTTLSTNLAAYFAKRGPIPTLMDCDPQGSSMTWIERRPVTSAPIHGIAAFKKTMQATRSWQLRVPQETTNLIVDSPRQPGSRRSSRSHPRCQQHTGTGIAIIHRYSRCLSLYCRLVIGRKS